MSTANPRPYATRSRAAAAAAKMAPTAAAAHVAPARRGAALGDITNAMAAATNNATNNSKHDHNPNISIKNPGPSAVHHPVAVKDKADAGAGVRRTALTKPTSAAAQRRARAARQRKAAAAAAAAKEAAAVTAAAATAAVAVAAESVANATKAALASHDATADHYHHRDRLLNRQHHHLDAGDRDETGDADDDEDAKSELAMRVATKARIADADGTVPPVAAGALVDLDQPSIIAYHVFGGTGVPAAATDIDIGEAEDPLAASQFAPYIFEHFRSVETKFMVPPDYMDLQEDITVKMRAILVDWLVDVHQKFKLSPETLYLTVNIIDRFLAVTPVKRRKLQLVGVTAMLIASKYEEIYAPETADFVYISDKAYDREEILHMEAVILGVLKFDVTVPSPLVFLNRCLKAARAPSLSLHSSQSSPSSLKPPAATTGAVVAPVETPQTARAARAARRAAADRDGGDARLSDSLSPTPTNATTLAGTLSTSTPIAPSATISPDAEHLALYLLELSLQSATILPYSASIVAATACLLAGKLLSEDIWSPTLQHYSGDPHPADLEMCEAAMRLLLEAEVKGAATNKLTAIRRKFASPKYNEVSTQAMRLNLATPALFSLRPTAARAASDYACMDICCEEDSD